LRGAQPQHQPQRPRFGNAFAAGDAGGRAGRSFRSSGECMTCNGGPLSDTAASAVNIRCRAFQRRSGAGWGEHLDAAPTEAWPDGIKPSQHPSHLLAVNEMSWPGGEAHYWAGRLISDAQDAQCALFPGKPQSCKTGLPKGRRSPRSLAHEGKFIGRDCATKAHAELMRRRQGEPE